MYKKIALHPSTLEIYAKRLISEGVMTEGEVNKARADWRVRLDAEFEAGSGYKPNKADWLDGKWAGFKIAGEEEDARRGVTGVDVNVLKDIGRKITKVPDGFRVHRTIQRFLENRAKAIDNGVGIDWATGEALAFCSLLEEGHHVRLSGQDSERGTFSHRHAVLHDPTTGETHAPLQHLPTASASFEAYNSTLSEYAALGFEYGYSVAAPETLVLWEAQFGDFVNGAQIVIDQFVVSGRSKWGQTSRLTHLLPHGYEGNGPEHSSARLERFLQLAAQDNIRVANCTTSAQFFHLLRRQALDATARPLVVMTPKGLLRLKQATVTLDELTSGSFQPVLPEPGERAGMHRLVLCSGKVYYDIAGHDVRGLASGVHVARIELLYPFPLEQTSALVASFPDLREIVWAQEEPQNMGAWRSIRHRLEDAAGQASAVERIRYVGRPWRASPSEGYPTLHQHEQDRIVREALGFPAEA